ncbi:MAG: phosphatidate cytidylyltransferase [Bacteroidota bacterium]
MKKYLYEILAFIFLLMLPSCAAVAGIFKAGMFTGILIIVIVVALLIFIISRVSNK